MDKIINSSIYEDISDFVILSIEDIKKYITDFSLLRKDGIIYCKTDFTPLLFDHIRFSNRKYKLITHHSDFPIDEFRFLSKPACIKKWYAINPTYEHPDLIPIPIGTKTPEGKAYHEKQYNIKWFLENLERLKSNEKDKYTLYCNWSNYTNPNRKFIYDKLIKNVKCFSSSGLSFENFCEETSKHKFIVSPPGNGIDGERTWFSLYMNCIPIVIKNKIYDAWAELPIIQVNDYSEVTEELLENSLKKEYNLEKLYANYWIKRICN